MPNRLIHETSPYLLQHAHNPVDWYPWGEEALRAAREQDKPILLSIGYSACHWCHVMERESFESEAIARFMNERFINIKVDREERPDLDSIYMVAVQMMTGQGGWPLTVFLTPDLQPFYGGTYFPPEDRLGMPGFPRVLLAASEAYRTRRQEIEQSAREVSQHLQAHFAATAPPSALSEATLDEAARNLARQFDRVNGGFGGAPKFPAPMALEFLLRTWRRAGVPRALEMVEVTLTKMARGGIYDQVGGGFHRYAVDDVWLVPHFEKMLYDNALLARVYALAYQATGGPLYRRVTEETCDYVLREMTSPEGAFYSTQDADSEGEEGKFYVWTPEEIDAALPPREAEIAKRYFGVTEAGNFEGKTVLSVPEPPERVAADLAMSPDALEAAVREIRGRLYAARAGRVWPGRDEKVLAAWNGLMLRALAEVGAALDRPDYVDAATRCARFLREHLDRGGTLYRVFKDGRGHVDGYLEDYAALADGLVSLYEATFEPAWLDWAHDLLARAVDRFADPQGGGFFDTPATAGDLITRPKDVFDSATPSGNALAAEALLRVAALTGEAADRQRALDLIERWAGFAAEHPTGFGQLLCDADLALAPIDEVALVGDPADPGTRALLAVVRRPYLPHKVVALARPGGDEASRVPLLAGREAREGRPTAYVCRGFACLQPVTDPAALAGQLGLEAPPAA